MKKYSKFMSLILRHQPEVGNLTLDSAGWAKVTDVLAALRAHVGPISRTEFDTLVAENDKQRFAFNDRRDKIRASQGHSLAVELALPEATPPDRLYHGTKRSVLGSIIKDGLKPGKRQHVHLSADLDTANIVAARRAGESVILVIETKSCPHPFFLSENGVWLTEAVPPSALGVYFEGQ